MKRVLKIMILPMLLVIIIAGVLVYQYMNRIRYNDSLVYGNTAGNFYNGGLFCEANGYVYFSNPEAGNSLYRMLPDGREAEKVSGDGVCYINADSHYIYYARNGQNRDSDFSFLQFNTNSLCRVSVNGGQPTILDEAPTLYVTLINNDLYYIHYDEETLSTLYKIGIDGENKRQVTSEPLLLSPGQEGTLCYAGVSNDHDISLWNPETDTGSTVYGGICYQPIDTGKRLYFMDAENDYHVVYLDLDEGTVTELTDCRVDCYNLTDEYIYYQKNTEASQALCRKRLDGTEEEEIIREGIFSNINVTSQYIYFSSYHDPAQVYQTPADGYINVESFYIQYKN